jgi:hypothetical protein
MAEICKDKTSAYGKVVPVLIKHNAMKIYGKVEV